MGAAGRDFHDYLRFFRERPEFRVCCFTAHQIPFIEKRSFPVELAGPSYSNDIPIFSEERLPELIKEFDVDFVFLSYSDLPHEEVMHRASIVQASGASFALLGPRHTELVSSLPVVAVTASRTGAGKSPLSLAIAERLHARGHNVGVLRHPMPYGDLRAQAVQRFASQEDLDRHKCTIEEREEYQPYVDRGLVIYAGVDYEAILKAVESESDIILWDGGNNDASFVRADLQITVLDALRPGHELKYYPGETNLRRADILVLNKIGGANPEDIEQLRRSAAIANPRADIITSDLIVRIDSPETIAGKRVLVVEDGPTLTHGGMSQGAGYVAAMRCAPAEIIDPRPYARGSIAQAFTNFPHLGAVLPALGYAASQCDELAATIEAAKPDIVIDGSPAGITRIISLTMPVIPARYEFTQVDGPSVFDRIDALLAD